MIIFVKTGICESRPNLRDWRYLVQVLYKGGWNYQDFISFLWVKVLYKYFARINGSQQSSCCVLAGEIPGKCYFLNNIHINFERPTYFF